MTTTITATVVAADRRVDLSVLTTNTNAKTVTVSRQTRTLWVDVPSMTNSPITPNVAKTGKDWEFVYGVPLLYRARVYNSAGVLLEIGTIAAPVTVPGEGIWLRDVIKTQLSIPVQVVHMESGDTSDDTRAALLRPLGRSNPVVLTDVRSGSIGATTLLTETDSEHIALRALLSSGDVLLLTGPGAFNVLWPLYLSIGAVSWRRVSEHIDTARLVTYEWTQVDPPPSGVRATERTWADVKAGFTTWDQVLTTQTDWADLLYLPVTAVAADEEMVFP